MRRGQYADATVVDSKAEIQRTFDEISEGLGPEEAAAEPATGAPAVESGPEIPAAAAPKKPRARKAAVEAGAKRPPAKRRPKASREVET